MTTAAVAAVPLSDFDHRAQLRRAVIGSTVGTTIEWYDFLLYGQMAAIVFPKLYFPSADPLTGTLQAFAVFAVGFVARPIGAAIFGHYGDRIGRRATVRAAKSSPARHSAVFRSPCSAIDRSFKPSSADLEKNPVAVASSNSPCQLADRQCRGRRPQAYSRNPEAR